MLNPLFALDLIPPTPNLNGNTKESLQAMLTELIHAYAGVEEKLVACHDCWHGRNFVPQGTEEATIMRSMAEGAWRLRMIALNSMHAEIIELMQKIDRGDSPMLVEIGSVDVS